MTTPVPNDQSGKLLNHISHLSANAPNSGAWPEALSTVDFVGVCHQRHGLQPLCQCLDERRGL